jgi:hypothetical protein
VACPLLCLPPMRLRPVLLFAALLTSSTAVAAPAARPARPAKPVAAPRAVAPSHARSIARKVFAEQRQAQRSRARFFEKITVKRDYTGEHVLLHDAEVTAFLDLTDPLHPHFDSEAEVDDEFARFTGPNRTHILVVPTTPREHIGTKLDTPLQAADLEATLKVFKRAEALAKSLHIKGAKIFINASEQIGVGYLHVHIVGERDPSRAFPKL